MALVLMKQNRSWEGGTHRMKVGCKVCLGLDPHLLIPCCLQIYHTGVNSHDLHTAKLIYTRTFQPRAASLTKEIRRWQHVVDRMVHPEIAVAGV